MKLELHGGNLRGIGIIDDGAFADYVKIHKDDLFHAPETFSPLENTMVESFANAIRALKLSNIEEGQRIAVIGGGNIGLSIVSTLLAEANPEYILVIEPHNFLREKAMELGATGAVPPNKTKIKRFFKNRGSPQIVYDCAGNEKSLLLAIEIVRRGGLILFEGVYHGNLSIPIFLLNSKEISLKGCLGHDREDILEAIELFAQKKVDPKPFISDIIPLNDIMEGFERFLIPGERKFIKLVVEI